MLGLLAAASRDPGKVKRRRPMNAADANPSDGQNLDENRRESV